MKSYFQITSEPNFLNLYCRAFLLELKASLAAIAGDKRFHVCAYARVRSMESENTNNETDWTDMVINK